MAGRPVAGVLQGHVVTDTPVDGDFGQPVQFPLEAVEHGFDVVFPGNEQRMFFLDHLGMAVSGAGDQCADAAHHQVDRNLVIKHGNRNPAAVHHGVGVFGFAPDPGDAPLWTMNVARPWLLIFWRK